jgi:hypothetical protein
MARLEELTLGAQIGGVLADQPVTVVHVDWHGTEALSLVYREATGRVADQLLYRSDEPRLEVQTTTRPFSFDGDPALFRLASEARRISLAYLFDPWRSTTPCGVVGPAFPVHPQLRGSGRAPLPRGSGIAAPAFATSSQYAGGSARLLFVARRHPKACCRPPE